MNTEIPSHPFLITEIASLICSFLDPEDLRSISMTCKALLCVASCRMWRTVWPGSVRQLSLLEQTLRSDATLVDYRSFVHTFCWHQRDSDKRLQKIIHNDFFSVFQFRHLSRFALSYGHANDEMVVPMLSTATLLCHVDLTGCSGLTTKTILPLVDQLPQHQLETLMLYGCNQVNGEMLATLIRQQRQSLKYLRLTATTNTVLEAMLSCEKLSNLGLEHSEEDELSDGFLYRFSTSDICEQLVYLQLRDIVNLSSRHLNDLAGRLRRLTHVSIIECKRVDEQGFISLLERRGEQLESLELIGQRSVTNRVLESLFRHCTCLSYLDISGCVQLTPNIFCEANWPLTLKTLLVLRLESIITSEGIIPLLALPQIHTVCLRNSAAMDQALRFLGHLGPGPQRFYYDEENASLIRTPNFPGPPLRSFQL